MENTNNKPVSAHLTIFSGRDCSQHATTDSADAADKQTLITLTNSKTMCHELFQCIHKHHHHHHHSDTDIPSIRDNSASCHDLDNSRSVFPLDRIASAPSYIFTRAMAGAASSPAAVAKDIPRRISIGSDFPCSRHHHRRNSTALKFDKPSYIS